MIIDLILKKKVVVNFYKSRYKIKEEEVKTLRNRFEEFDRGLRISKKTKTILRKIQRETKEYTINQITKIKSKVKKTEKSKKNKKIGNSSNFISYTYNRPKHSNNSDYSSSYSSSDSCSSSDSSSSCSD